MHTSVIVAAYGPAETTVAAWRRARSLARGGRLTVFAALEPGTEGVAAVEGAGGRTVEGVGSQALHRALEATPPGPVLFVHDDVLVTRGTLTRMRAALDRHGGFVLPHSNDIGMDHFCGALPRVVDAAAAVEARGRALVGRAPQVRTARPSCLLASAEELRSLLGRHLPDPRSRLDVIDLPMRVAPGAVVAHDSSCTTRTRTRTIGASPPLLVAAMIVRDEEDMLPSCLESLRELVDRVVVVDTGSVDGTVEIARRAGAEVLHRPWRDDFGWARSEALLAADDATWVLTVDADDRVVCPDRSLVRDLLATYEGEYDAFGVVVHNRAGSLDGPASSSFDSPRIFRAGLFRYRGAVHEVLSYRDRIAAPSAPRLEALEIVHVGYDPALVDERGKAERNLALARELFEGDPSPKHAIEYARSIKFAGGDAREAYDLLASIVDRVPPEQVKTLAYIHTLMAEDLLALGDPEAALEHGRAALELVPADDLAAQTHSKAALRLCRPDELLQMEEHRSSVASVSPLFRSEGARRSARSMSSVARAMLGRLAEAREVAGEVLRDDPTAFGGWEPLVAAHVGLPLDRARGELLGLALLDGSGHAFAAVAKHFVPSFTAEFCRRYVELGGGLPEAVRVGLLAALVAGDGETFGALARSADRLDRELVDAIAARAEARGRGDLAAILRGPSTEAPRSA